MDTYKNYLKNTNAYPTDKNGWPCYIGINRKPTRTIGYYLVQSTDKKAKYYIYAGKYEVEVTIKDGELVIDIPSAGRIDKNIVVLTEPEFNETQDEYLSITPMITLRNLFNSKRGLEKDGKTSILTLEIPDMTETGLDTIVAIYTDEKEQLMVSYAHSQDRPVNIATARLLNEKLTEKAQ